MSEDGPSLPEVHVVFERWLIGVGGSLGGVFDELLLRHSEGDRHGRGGEGKAGNGSQPRLQAVKWRQFSKPPTPPLFTLPLSDHQELWPVQGFFSFFSWLTTRTETTTNPVVRSGASCN